MMENIIAEYGLDPLRGKMTIISHGLINNTVRVDYNDDVQRSYILQRINDQVFTDPSIIDKNMSILRKHIQINNISIVLPLPLMAVNGKFLIEYNNSFYRMFDFIEAITFDSVYNTEIAFEAAKQFGKLTRVFSTLEPSSLSITLPNFHNLSLRYDHYKTALLQSSLERRSTADAAIKFADCFASIVSEYNTLMLFNCMSLRVIHHDTKISNVLFDGNYKGLCVIDLDTVMPGYYISDIGDMFRTYLCPVTEEDFSDSFRHVKIRKEYFEAIIRGYLIEMTGIIGKEELSYIIFAGKFMIYMQAIRFLTDYLQNDIYYGTRYEGHNLNRALNQFHLLSDYCKNEEILQAIVEAVLQDTHKNIRENSRINGLLAFG